MALQFCQIPVDHEVQKSGGQVDWWYGKIGSLMFILDMNMQRGRGKLFTMRKLIQNPLYHEKTHTEYLII